MTHFPDDRTPDHVWIADIAARGWIIITRDKSARRRPDVQQAVRASGAKLFNLAPKGLDAWEAAVLGAQHRLVQRLGWRGYVIGTINRDGTVRDIESERGSRKRRHEKD